MDANTESLNGLTPKRGRRRGRSSKQEMLLRADTPLSSNQAEDVDDKASEIIPRIIIKKKAVRQSSRIKFLDEIQSILLTASIVFGSASLVTMAFFTTQLVLTVKQEAELNIRISTDLESVINRIDGIVGSSVPAPKVPVNTKKR